MRLIIFALIMASMLVACDSSGDNSEATQDLTLPTRAVLPDVTDEVTTEVTQVTDEPTATDEPTDIPTDTPEPIATNTSQPTATNTRPATATSAPLATLTFTPALDIPASQTAQVIEAPVFSTLTPIPIPAGGTALPTATLQVIAADIVITTQQFQEELDLLTEQMPEINSARLSFATGETQGVMINLSARGGQALTNGNVLITFQQSGSQVLIGVGEINVGSGTPPQRYVEIVNNQLYFAVLDAFDAILTQRLGERHDLQSIVFTATEMQIMLLVPEN